MHQPESRLHRPTGVVCILGQGWTVRAFLAVQRGAFDATKLVMIKQLRQ